MSLDPADNQRLATLCGQLDSHIKRIEAYFGVQITNRGAVFNISGDRGPAESAGRSLRELYAETENDADLDDRTLERVMRKAARVEESAAPQAALKLRTPNKQVRPHNARQATTCSPS